MQGTVSLAVALALPSTTTRGGGAFPQRILIMFLTFAVIFVTLAGQGLALPGRPDLGSLSRRATLLWPAPRPRLTLVTSHSLTPRRQACAHDTGQAGAAAGSSGRPDE